MSRNNGNNRGGRVEISWRQGPPSDRRDAATMSCNARRCSTACVGPEKNQRKASNLNPVRKVRKKPVGKAESETGRGQPKSGQPKFSRALPLSTGMRRTGTPVWEACRMSWEAGRRWGWKKGLMKQPKRTAAPARRGRRYEGRTRKLGRGSIQGVWGRNRLKCKRQAVRGGHAKRKMAGGRTSKAAPAIRQREAQGQAQPGRITKKEANPGKAGMNWHTAGIRHVGAGTARTEKGQRGAVNDEKTHRNRKKPIQHTSQAHECKQWWRQPRPQRRNV